MNFKNGNSVEDYMGEFLYKIGQRTGPAPVIRKLGAAAPGMEQTPFVHGGRLYMAESRGADKECPVQHIRIRDYETGELSPPFGLNFYFASAYYENGLVYVFATSTLDDKPLTMYVGDDSAEWHDPRGGHTVRMFVSSDFTNWRSKDIVNVPNRRLWNTSVCKGPDGYVMAIEESGEKVRTSEEVGVPFTCFFAVSKDLENWECLPDKYCYTRTRYNACPVMRYFGGWYYMICLEAFPCARYAPYIYRTKDFLDWEVGFHNPIMIWDDRDRIPKEGVSFDAEKLDLLKYGLNINCSDLDLCEFGGKTRIFYSNGDQMTYSFICEADYDGSLQDFMESFFR